MSLVPTFLRGTYSFGIRSKDGRDGTLNLAGLLPKSAETPKTVARGYKAAPKAADPHAAEQPDPRAVMDMLNHASEALDYLQTRCRDLETESEEAGRRAKRALTEARKSGNAWQRRALASEARVEELQTRLAAADETAMELRARVVCLYGKLAASVDTVRFQNLARALAGHDVTFGEPLLLERPQDVAA